jgi:hypothetical protein
MAVVAAMRAVLVPGHVRMAPTACRLAKGALGVLALPHSNLGCLWSPPSWPALTDDRCALQDALHRSKREASQTIEIKTNLKRKLLGRPWTIDRAAD